MIVLSEGVGRESVIVCERRKSRQKKAGRSRKESEESGALYRGTRHLERAVASHENKRALTFLDGTEVLIATFIGCVMSFVKSGFDPCEMHRRENLAGSSFGKEVLMAQSSNWRSRGPTMCPKEWIHGTIMAMSHHNTMTTLTAFTLPAWGLWP